MMSELLALEVFLAECPPKVLDLQGGGERLWGKDSIVVPDGIFYFIHPDSA